MNDMVEAPKQRTSEGEFRHYVFGLPELRAETERFLKQAGYEMKPTKYVGLVQPDFRAKRKAGNGAFELVGMVRENLDQAVEALVKLAAIKAASRDVDCALVLPPINEYLLIEWLTEESGRWYFGTRDSRIMIWFSNPDDRTTICVLGKPLDQEFLKHFYMSQMSFDDYISIRHPNLVKERILAEEEED
jgi:hypothetical protein